MAIEKIPLEQLANQVTIILGTAGKDGKPNLAPIALYWLLGDDTLVIGDLHLKRVVDHVLENPQVQVCFWDEDTHKTFKYDGIASYETEGEAMDLADEAMKAAGDEAAALKGVVRIALK
jgi:predicted pyridoxine 5'-phosphate oxidase superfamily flavin-nucleotide-binding protein